MADTQTLRSLPVRELDPEQFRARFGCDRFTATIIANRFRYVVEHMCADLLTSAFSPIIRDWYDFAATLCGPPSLGYPTPAVSNSLVVFIGTMADSVRNTIEEYGPERLEPGDVIVGNDPYRTGTHVNDLLLVRPVFHEGRIITFVNITAHQLDMGGPVPGGFSGTKRNVFENGLVLSPRALFRAGEPVRETWALIFDNVRFVDLLFPDMKLICADLELGERLLLESAERYGGEAILGAMEYVCDAGAERMADALAALPDGDWEAEDGVDCDGVDDTEAYRVKVRIRKRGRHAEVDLSGSSRQARTCINGSALDSKSSVGVAFKYAFDPDGAFTSGMMRPIDVVLPEGSMLAALPPDGAVFLYWETTGALVSAIFRALAAALGPEAIAGDVGSANIHNANGVRADGTPWVSGAQCGGEHGPRGATRAGDADSYTFHFQANNIDPALESIESDIPVVITRREYVPDTGGPGAFRGGAGVLKDSLWLEEAEHRSMPMRFKISTGFGVNGGRDGMTGGVWIWEANDGRPFVPTDAAAYRDATPVAGVLDPDTHVPSRDGEYRFFASVPVWRTGPRSTFRYVTNAGGGWGDPLERDPEAVKRDVRDGYVTIDGAARDYGVVVRGDPDEHPEQLELDLEATARRRTELRHG
jgi:N-methylhydantoinase B